LSVFRNNAIFKSGYINIGELLGADLVTVAFIDDNVNKTNQNTNIVCLYRAVGDVEFYSIMRNKKFSIKPNGAHAKYFSMNFEETKTFAEKVINIDVAAIVEVIIMRDVLSKLGDFTHVDPFLFKSGTVVIQSENLVDFNNAIIKITHVY